MHTENGACSRISLFFFAKYDQIGSVLHYVTNPVQALLEEVINLVGATPETLLRLVALAACLALVCEGFRAADDIVGGRIALAGVAGAVLCYRYEAGPGRFARQCWYVGCSPVVLGRL